MLVTVSGRNVCISSCARCKHPLTCDCLVRMKHLYLSYPFSVALRKGFFFRAVAAMQYNTITGYGQPERRSISLYEWVLVGYIR